MAWVRIDDTMTFNPKVMKAGNAAVGAWIRLSAYSSAHGLDGKVPSEIAGMVASQRELEQAIAAGLIHRDGDGYEIHDFLEYNPSAVEVAERRAQRSNAGRLGGKQSGATRRSKVEASASSEDEANAKQVASTKTNPVPSRPVPSGSEKERRASIDPRVMRALQQHKILMPDAQTVQQLCAKAAEYAEAAGMDPVDAAVLAIDSFPAVAGKWQSPKPPLPHLVLKHWEEVQAAMGGYAPTKPKQTAAARLAELAERDRGDA